MSGNALRKMWITCRSQRCNKLMDNATLIFWCADCLLRMIYRKLVSTNNSQVEWRNGQEIESKKGKKQFEKLQSTILRKKHFSTSLFCALQLIQGWQWRENWAKWLNFRIEAPAGKREVSLFLLWFLRAQDALKIIEDLQELFGMDVYSDTGIGKGRRLGLKSLWNSQIDIPANHFGEGEALNKLR